jgi:hypothetical protein
VSVGGPVAGRRNLARGSPSSRRTGWHEGPPDLHEDHGSVRRSVLDEASRRERAGANDGEALEDPPTFPNADASLQHWGSLVPGSAGRGFLRPTWSTLSPALLGRPRAARRLTWRDPDSNRGHHDFQGPQADRRGRIWDFVGLRSPNCTGHFSDERAFRPIGCVSAVQTSEVPRGWSGAPHSGDRWLLGNLEWLSRSWYCSLTTGSDTNDASLKTRTRAGRNEVTGPRGTSRTPLARSSVPDRGLHGGLEVPNPRWSVRR